jgi:hypothetical protein
MKNHTNRYLENKTVIDRDLYYTYFFLNTTIGAKKRLNKLINFLIFLVSLVGIVAVIGNINRQVSAATPDNFLMLINIIAIIMHVVNLAFLVYYFSGTRRYQLLVSRLIMLFALVSLSLSLDETSGQNIWLFRGIAISVSAGLIFTFFLYNKMRQKSYENHRELSYSYTFRPQVFDIVMSLKGEVADLTHDYRFYKVYELDDCYFALLDPGHTLFIDRHSFTNGDYHDFETMLESRDVNIIHLNFSYGQRNRTDNC